MKQENRQALQPTRLTYVPPVTITRRDFQSDGSDIWFREAIYAIVQALDRLLTCREAFGRALALTATQYAVLMGVAHRQGGSGVTIKQLAKHVALASTHVTTEVGRMSHMGLLLKRRGERDRRSVLVSLTCEGEIEVARISEFVRSVNDLLFEDISRRDLAAAARVARTINANWQAVSTAIQSSQQTAPR
jgi:DNA-binding MarR family transcriptional regulator